MLWFVFAILASLCWGVAQVLVKKGFEHTSPLFNNFLGMIFGCLIFIPFSLIGGVNWALIPKIIFFVFLAAGSTMIYYYAVEKGEISLTGTLISAYPIITILLSSIFLGETTDIFQKIAILLIIVGSFFVSKPAKFSFKFESWVVWASITVIFAGFGDFMGKLALSKSDVHTFMFVFALGYIASMIFLYIVDKKERNFPKMNQRKMIPTLSGTFLMEIGTLFVYLAFSLGKASLVSPVSSSFAAVTVILAVIFLREKLTKTQVIGIILAVLGIILIGA